MKIPLILLSLILCVPVLQAGIIIEVMTISKEQITQKHIPITCEIVRKDDGDLILKFTLKEQFGAVGNFGPTGKFNAYELRVLKKPVPIPELTTKTYLDLDLIARRERSREKSAEFQVKKDEVANAYIVVESWDGEQNGMSKLRSVCISVPALVAQ